jgi:hypothetical protein
MANQAIELTGSMTLLENHASRFIKYGAGGHRPARVQSSEMRKVG